MTRMILALLVAITLLNGCKKDNEENAGVVLPSLHLLETKPNICFVNVGEAVPEAEFALAVSNACASQVQVRWQTVAMPEFKELMDLVTSRRNQIEVFGEPVKLVVYIVNNDILPGLLSIPGQCALINIRRMRFDRPSEDVFRKRLIKIAMKGLALAGGVAGNGDAQCVMYWKSFSVIGIDKTSATFSPMCFFVLQDTLDEIGTSEIFRPEY